MVSVDVGTDELSTGSKDNVIVVTSVSRVEHGVRVACAYDAEKSCDVAVTGNVRCVPVNARHVWRAYMPARLRSCRYGNVLYYQNSETRKERSVRTRPDRSVPVWLVNMARPTLNTSACRCLLLMLCRPRTPC